MTMPSRAGDVRAPFPPRYPAGPFTAPPRPMRRQRSVSSRLHLFPGALPIAALLIVLGLLGPNLWLTVVSIAALLLGGSLLWRPGEPPILLVIFAVHWIQAAIGIYHASWLGISVDEMSWFDGDVSLAHLLSLGGLTCLAIGMRIGAGAQREADAGLARVSALRNPPQEWFRLYLIAFGVSFVLQTFAGSFAGLTQPVLALAHLKWAFFWILSFATFANPNANRRYWAIAFVLELAIGFGGYFSGFKTVLIVSAIAVVAARLRVSRGGWFAIGAAAAALMATGILWTAVKPEYRNYVSGGRAQVVNVDYGARIIKLFDLAVTRNGAQLSQAVEDLLERLSYVQFFGGVLTTVPTVVPHENGALWSDAITRPFMPRLFFPDKAPISDSARTNTYAGVPVAGDESGTSISIGYMGESYIDFGAIGMMVPITALGLMIGLGYRWLLRGDPSQVLLGMALATAVGVNVIYLETSITKLFGSLIVSFLGAAFVIRFLAPRYLRWTRLPIRRMR